MLGGAKQEGNTRKETHGMLGNRVKPSRLPMNVLRTPRKTTYRQHTPVVTKKRFQPVTFLGFLLGKYCFTTTNPPNIERLENRQRYLVVLDKGYRAARRSHDLLLRKPRIAFCRTRRDKEYKVVVHPGLRPIYP